MSDVDNPLERRRFLKAAATGGVAGATALAGCGGDQDSDGTETTGGGDQNGGGDDQDTTAEMGDPFPELLYLNNPANYNAPRHDAINLIGTQLNKTGLNVSVEVFEWGTLYNRVMNEQTFSFTTWNRGLGIDPGRRMPEMFHSSNTAPGQGNFTGYVNKDLDPTLMKQLSTTDRQERIDMLHEIQATINEDVPMHPIVQMPSLMGYNSNQVSGWVDHLSGYNHMQSMVNIEVDNEDNTLRGTWPETLGTLNVLGYNNETKLIVQFNMIYDHLVVINNELQPDPELSLASDFEHPDLRTARYLIDKDHQFHDGEPVTAEDVAFTLRYIRDNEIPLYATQWGMYKDGEVTVDGDWVEVKFSQDVGPVHTLFSNQIPILPKHKWESRNNPTNTTISEPVGSGPAKLEYWDEGSEISLRRHEEHFNPPNWDRRIWRIIPSTSTVWSLLKDGELNYLPFSKINRQLSQNQKLDQIGVKQTSGDGWWHFSQNTRKEGLDDPAVRRALVWAIPKTAISKQLLYDFPKRGWNLIGESFGAFSNPDVPKYWGGGPEKSKQVLKEAGYVFDQDGNVHFPAE